MFVNVPSVPINKIIKMAISVRDHKQRITNLIATPVQSMLVAISRWRQPSGICGIIKQPSRGRFLRRVSLLLNAQDLESIFQVSQLESTVTLTLQ